MAATALLFMSLTAFMTPVWAANVSLTAAPSSSTVVNGANFSVNLVINTDTPIRGWQAQVNFIAAGMQCTGISEGNFLKDFAVEIGGTTISYGSPVIDNDNGQATNINFAIVGQNPGGPKGNGILCTLNFTAKPAVNVNCSVSPIDVILIDDNPTKPAAIPNVTVNAGSFTIGPPPPPPPPPPAGGGVTIMPTLVPQGFAANTPLTLDYSGKIQSDTELKTEDGKLKLEIAKGTQLLSSAGSPLVSLSTSGLNSAANLPAGSALIMACTLSPDGATFAPALTLKMGYDPAKLPENVAENSLFIASAQGTTWKTLTSTVDEQTHTVSTPVAHFSSYALLGIIVTPPASTPAPTPSPSGTPVLTPTPTPTPSPSPTGFASSTTSVTTKPSPSVPVTTTITPPVTPTPSPAAPSSSLPAPSITSTATSAATAAATSPNWWLFGGIGFGCLVGLIIVILLIRRH
jgi:hypothetical protein